MLKRGLRAIVGLAAPRAAAAGQASGPTPASWRTRTAGSLGPGAFGSGLRESQWTRANGLRALSGHIFIEIHRFEEVSLFLLLYRDPALYDDSILRSWRARDTVTLFSPCPAPSVRVLSPRVQMAKGQ